MRQKTSALRLVVSMGASLSQEAQDLATSTGIALHTMAQVEVSQSVSQSVGQLVGMPVLFI